jgi:hypothetical protein
MQSDERVEPVASDRESPAGSAVATATRTDLPSRDRCVGLASARHRFARPRRTA